MHSANRSSLAAAGLVACAIALAAPAEAQCSARPSVSMYVDPPPVLDNPAPVVLARAGATLALPATDPSRPAALLELVEAYRTTNQLDELVRVAATFLADHPTAPGADAVHYRLGRALMARGDDTESRRVFMHLIRDFPSSGWVGASYIVFGDYYARQGDPSTARQFYERARDLPGAPTAYTEYALAWAHAQLRDPRAVDALDRALAASSVGALPADLRSAIVTERATILALLRCP